MKRSKPTCLECEKKPARKGSVFCTNKCAASWADEMNAVTDTIWCPVNREWEHDGGMRLCHGCGAELDNEEGADHISGHQQVTGER